MEAVIERLKNSPESSVRYRLAVGVLQMDENLSEVKTLCKEVKNSLRVNQMLSLRDTEGKIPLHAYNKWKGAFWTLLVLAEMGYPPGDDSLIPLREQVFDWLFDPGRLKRIPTIKGLTRRCALQEASAVFSLLKLGLADSRIDTLVEWLLKWQWPDGGWNCEKKPQASHSSFYETWIPLRALNVYYKHTSKTEVKIAVDRASEVFLRHKLFKNTTTDKVITPNFTMLAYPPYWHYDILVGLKAMAEVGRINDPRCDDALDLLESKRLPDGGFPAETRYYKVTETKMSNSSLVDWGPVSHKQSNEFVTVDALAVLKQTGRFNPNLT